MSAQTLHVRVKVLASFSTSNLFRQSFRQLFARFWRTCEHVLCALVNMCFPENIDESMLACEAVANLHAIARRRIKPIIVASLRSDQIHLFLSACLLKVAPAGIPRLFVSVACGQD